MKNHRKILLFGIILLAGLACQAAEQLSSAPTPELNQTTGDSPGNQNSSGAATITPTPFLPSEATIPAVTPTPEVTPAWGGYPGPSVQPAIPIPPPVDPIQQPAGQVNILLLGSDQRPGEGGFRTDTILLLTLNPNQGTVHITSFPRDLYVYIPGWTMQRINTAQQKGGFALTSATFEYNFGTPLDHFVMINFAGFVSTIDSLGGIDVNVPQALSEGDYSVSPGLVHMNGEMALWYVRSRYTTNDFDRTRRQQEVLLAIFRKLISLNGIQRAPELYELYRDNVVTDMAFSDMTPFIGLASQIAQDTSKVQSYYLGPQQVTPYRVPSTGAQVLLPKREAVLEVMRQALNAP